MFSISRVADLKLVSTRGSAVLSLPLKLVVPGLPHAMIPGGIPKLFKWYTTQWDLLNGILYDLQK
jgi:hypothetical protein